MQTGHAGTYVARCDNCGSPDLDPFAERVLKCRYCGHLNEVTIEPQGAGAAPGCEVDGCGVQAIGRCHTCGHAFCGSHQAIVPKGPRVVNLCSSCHASIQAEKAAAAAATAPPATWASEMVRWGASLTPLPERPTVGLMSRARGLSAGHLPGKALAEIAEVYGRPSWWLAEPQTGGLMVGWAKHPDMAVHLVADGTCDKVLTPVRNELPLSWALRRLGNLIGKPMDIVIQWLGTPNSRNHGPGYILLQWQRPGYHIALNFAPDGRCLGITHQRAAHPR